MDQVKISIDPYRRIKLATAFRVFFFFFFLYIRVRVRVVKTKGEEKDIFSSRVFVRE